jgi:hypothetical protein
MAATAILAGAAWMGLSGEAQAQSLILPTGPLALRAPSPTVLDLKSNDPQIYPGRTMGGGTRILRINPPPSSLKRRKE